jgi:nucleoside-diphosphate-sugar epimerase
MKIFLTGATGFIGGEVARRLRKRCDDVVALVRSPENAGELKAIGCELVAGDLSDVSVIEAAVGECEAVIHCAAIYEVAIAESRRPAMREANVDGTVNVLTAAKVAGVSKAVYVSTCGTFGNTHGKIVSEGYGHPGPTFDSCYEETKVLAHREAERLAAEGLQLVIVQPGGVYGPNDTSAIGEVIRKFAKKQLPAMLFPELGLSLVHRDDVAAGIILALDSGRSGESYVLGGQIETMRGLIATEARILGRKVPKITIPAGLIRALHPLGRVVGPALGAGPNLKEMVDSADGVTFWATSDKAKSELGYRPRDLEEGLRETLAAEGLLN